MRAELVRINIEVSQDKSRMTIWKKNVRESVRSSVEREEWMETISDAVGEGRGAAAADGRAVVGLAGVHDSGVRKATERTMHLLTTSC